MTMPFLTLTGRPWMFWIASLIPVTALAQPIIVDPGFASGAGFTGSDLNGLVASVAVQPDGNVIVGGWFDQYNGTAANRIIRLLPTGEQDPTFQTGSAFDGPVLLVALQPNGKVIVSGSFSSYDGTPCGYMVRLLPNGQLDNTFTPFAPTPFSGAVLFDIEMLPDGSFYGGGANGVARYNANGAYDLSVQFEPTSGTVEEIALRPDGRLLAVGDITRDDNNAVIGIGQFLTTGVQDPSFVPPSGVFGVMRSVALRPDGIALVAGAPVNGRDRLLALTENGSPAPDFNVAAYQFLNIQALMTEVNGDVLVGLSSVIGPTSHQGLCRVRTTGMVDPACNANASLVTAIALLADDRIYIAGGFTSVLGTSLPRLARIRRKGVSLQMKAHLGGAYMGNGLMSGSLAAQGLVPLAEPYSGLGFAQAGGGGAEATTPALLQAGGDNSVVDWVLVEVRSGTTPSTLLATQSALLQVDGDVVAADGSPLVTFPLLPGGYHIALRHRNHLGVMSAGLTPTVVPGTVISIDLRQPATATFGSNAQRNVDGTMVLWPGDGLRDGSVAYTGQGNDRDPILVMVGSTTPNNVVTGTYSVLDSNLNGTVSYVGANNDRDPILLTVGSTTPNSVRQAQLP